MEKSKMKNELMDWLKAIIVAVIVVGGIQFFLVAPVEVDGQSMQPTLNSGNKLFVNKIDYAVSTPERFDVIVFHATDEADFIKRVIGLPGEHVAYKNDQLFINGKPIDESYLDIPRQQFHEQDLLFTQDFSLEAVTNESVIPSGYVFVLGDNRNASTDSRILGLIPVSEIVGSTSLVFWPVHQAGTVKTNTK